MGSTITDEQLRILATAKWPLISTPELRAIATELLAARADVRRLDALESCPCAMLIRTQMDQPKSDSVPSIRSQIDYFIEHGLPLIQQEYSIAMREAENAKP